MLVEGLKTTSELIRFLEKHGNTSAKLQVLLFWGRHPRAKFTLDCIADALDARRLDLKEAVETLVSEGIIERQSDNNGVTWYCVSQPKREYAEALAMLEWSEIKYWEDQFVRRSLVFCP